jgi:hypothetical protein
MRRSDAKFVAIPKPEISEFCLANASCILQHGIKYRLQFARRRTYDFENLRGGGKLFYCLVTLASEQSNLRSGALAGLSATATDLWRIATLKRCRVSASRFNRFAACSGAPSHCSPMAQDKASYRLKLA